SYVLYLRNMIWPLNLGPIYPLPKSFVAWQVAAAVALLAAITTTVAWARRRSPYLLVGWLWYFGTLVPVIGLLRLGADVSMADRWVYLPLLGIYIAIVWGLCDVLRDTLRHSRRGRVAVTTMAILLLVKIA